MANLSHIAEALMANKSAHVRLKWKFMENGWLNSSDKPIAEELVFLALGRIKNDANQYRKFTAMLQDIPGLDLIAKRLSGKIMFT